MPLKYNVIEVFTCEEARWQGRPVHDAVVDHVRKCRVAARCIVTRGYAGCYENGEIASRSIEVLSFNMPIKIEIILPAAELEAVLSGLEDIVTDGIVAVQDMEVRLHRARKCLIPRQLRVQDAMSASPKSVFEDTSASDVIRLLLTNDFNAVPVVDAAGDPVGIITQGDLISRAQMPVRLGLLAQLEASQVDEFLQSACRKTAGEVMTKPVVTVHEEKRLGEAVDLMLRHHFKRLPVVDAQGKLVGVIARSDVFHVITRETPDWEAIRAREVSVGNVTVVGDIMRRDTHKVSPDAHVEEVARLIDDTDIQRVAVVDADGKLLGLISDADLLGLFSDHRAGMWDYLVRRLPFGEIATRHQGLIERTRARMASEVMKTDLVTVREDTGIEDAVRLMAEHRIKRLPVVDRDGVFKGLVSRESVLRAGVEQS